MNANKSLRAIWALRLFAFIRVHSRPNSNRSKIVPMRRLSASVLLLLFSLSLIGQVAFADAGSKLPACCRRLGAHHCAMGHPGATSTGGSLFQAAGRKCPAFPSAPAVPVHSHSGLLPAGHSVVLSAFSHPAGTAQAESRCRISFSRSCQKRGPPSTL
jgi:hypothetical protein